MLEFTPLREDAVELALWVAARDGSEVRSRVYSWMIGLCLAVLAGALGGWAVGQLLAEETRVPAVVGITVGAVGWVLLTAAAPGARRSWSERRAITRARREFHPRGVVRVWLDDAGVNTVVGGVHTHLSWAGLERVSEAGRHVLIVPRFFGPVLSIPKRIGEEGVERFASEARLRFAAASAPNGSVRTFAEVSPTPATQYPQRTAMLDLQVTAMDLQALAAGIQRQDPPSRELREYRLVRTARTFVIGFVVLAAVNRNTLRLAGFDALPAILLLSTLLGAIAWFLAERSFVRIESARADLEGRHRLAAGGDHRQLWLDDTGLGQQDAVTVEHAAWPAVSLEATTEHYLLYTPGNFDVVIPRRVPGAEDFITAVQARLR